MGRPHRDDFATVAIERVSAVAAVVGHAELVAGDQVDRDVPLENGDVRMQANLARQRVLHGEARGIRHVYDAARAVAPFAGEVVARFVASKGDALFDQPVYGLAAVLDDEARRLGVIQEGARDDGVADVRLDRILAIQYGGNAALSPAGSAVLQRTLADQRHLVGFCETEGRRLSGQTTADNENVEAKCHDRSLANKGRNYIMSVAGQYPWRRMNHFRSVWSHWIANALSLPRFGGCAILWRKTQHRPTGNLQSMSERDIDQKLVERAQAGDRHAFELLVAKYQRKLGRLLSRFIRDHAEVEDVAQEAFIKAYRALPSFRGDSAFYTWLYRIGINTAKNYLVAQGRRAPTSTDFDADEAEGFEDADQLRDINTPESLLQSKQIGETVNAAIESLPEELRTAIVLREIEGLSYEEIAEAMNCPIGTVRSRIFRAREAVAAKLRPLLDTSPDRRW